MSQRLICLLAVLLAISLLGGCGGQDTPVEQAEEEAGVEEIVEEETTSAPYQAPPRDAEEAAADEAKQKAAKENQRAKGGGDRPEILNISTIFECQMRRATVGMSQQEVEAYSDQLTEEVLERPGVSVQGIMRERGYDCGWTEFQQGRGNE